MLDDRNRYWPAEVDELENRPSWINEPPPNNVAMLAPRERSLHAVLCGALTNTQALLTRLETGRVQAPPGAGRIVVRELYVSVRRTVEALSAALEQDLE